MVAYTKSRIEAIIDHILKMWGEAIYLETKSFGPLETYSCKSISLVHRRVSSSIDLQDYDELVGIVEFHIGRIALEASKYITVLRPSELDREIILKEVCAREEIAFLEAPTELR